jgi:Secretion system C-terminal sorting domain/FG-GAP repeat
MLSFVFYSHCVKAMPLGPILSKLSLICLLLIGSISINAQNWTQLGTDINGETAFNQSGHAISLSADGQTVAIGAYLNEGSGLNAGHVRVYQRISGIWLQIGADIDAEAINDYSGWSVSLSDNGLSVAIGAYQNSGNGLHAGQVRVFQFVSGNWVQQGADLDGEAAGDQFGFSVSLSADGQTVAVGAPDNAGNGEQAGHVRIFKFNDNTWQQLGSDLNGEAAGDRSGSTVSMSSDGQTVAIGSQYNDGNGAESGHVRVYQWVDGAWAQQGADVDGEAAGDFSGYSVNLSIDGKTIAVGAPQNDGNGLNAGQTRVYKLISGSWAQLGADINGESTGDWAGYSVSLSADGQTVAIGAVLNDENGLDAGQTRVYKLVSGIWTQLGADIDSEAANDWSGYSVSLSADGQAVAIGAPFNDANGFDAGHVRIYTLGCQFSDNTPPTAVCQNLTVVLDANGEATISENQVNNGSADNCGLQSSVLSQTYFDCSNLGANTVILTVTDQSNLTATCSAVVTLSSNTELLSLSEITVNCFDNGTVDIATDDLYSYTFTVTNGSFLGNYAVSDGLTTLGTPAYGTAFVSAQAPIAGASVLTLTIADATLASCLVTATVAPPAPCSNQMPSACEMIIASVEVNCSGNGTSFIAEDDQFYATLTINQTDSCADHWYGNEYIGDFGTPVTFGPYLIIEGNQYFYVTNGLGAQTIVVIPSPAPCSEEVLTSCDAITVTAGIGILSIQLVPSAHKRVKVLDANGLIVLDCLDGDCPGNPILLTGLIPGAYTVELFLMDANWQSICTKLASYDVLSTMEGLAIDLPQTLQLVSIYPNPTFYEVFFVLSSPKEQTATIEFFDARGVLIDTQIKSLNLGTNAIGHDVQDWNSGVYSVVVTDENGLTQAGRFVKIP